MIKKLDDNQATPEEKLTLLKELNASAKAFNERLKRILELAREKRAAK